MRLIDKFIAVTSIFALFTEDFSFHYIIDIKLFYLILLLNTTLLIFINNFYFNKNLIFVITFLGLHGILTSIIYKTPIQALFAQILGIGISSIFYYNVIKTYGVKTLFEIYLKIAFVVACLAIPMFFLRINVFADGTRLNGILTEPAHYAAIMLPASYVLFKSKRHFRFGLLLVTILLSRSTIGYLGLLLILMLPLIRIKYFIKYSVFVLIVLSLGIFYISSKWNESVNSEDSNVFMRRVKQTYESFSSSMVGRFDNSTNLSTYALLSNVFISKESFKAYPFGSGLGSYPYQYEKYYPEMRPPKYLVQLGLSKINKQDANSLFLRIIVDFGIFSLLFFIYFTFRSIKVFTEERTFQQGSFFYLFVKLIREGHYFPPEFYFFLLIFIKEFHEDTTHFGGLLPE